MSIISYYTRGVGNPIPGVPLESDGQFVTIFNPYGTPLYAATNIALAAFPASTNVGFTIIQNTSGATFTDVVITDATPTGDEILGRLYGILPPTVSVTFNSTTNIFTFTSTVPGADGAFTLIINGVTSANAPAAGLAPTFRAGRIVVPVTNNNDLSVPYGSSTRRWRYPVLTDTLQTLQQAVVVMNDGSLNRSLISNKDTQRQTVPGSTSTGMSKGLVAIFPVSAISSTNTILLETNVVNDTVGRLTAIATATTITVPATKFFIESGTLVAGRPAALRL